MVGWMMDRGSCSGVMEVLCDIRGKFSRELPAELTNGDLDGRVIC